MRCPSCDLEFMLRYFPPLATQPDGHWVHCFGCRYELRLIVRPPRQCVVLHAAALDTYACSAAC